MATLFLSPTASAQPFQPGSWSGSLETAGGYTRQDARSSDSRGSRFESLRTNEQLTLRNTGSYIYDPRLVTLSLGGTFSLFQERDNADGIRNEREGKLEGYDFFGDVLPGRTVSLNLFANRNEAVVARELAGHSNVRNENQGGTLFLRRLRIPSSFGFRRELREEETRIGNTLARVEDERNIFTYEGERSWDGGRIDIRYQYVDFLDVTDPQLSFRNHEGSLTYAVDFGPEDNWHWETRLRGLDRGGIAALRIWDLDQLLRIDHTDDFRTEYRYLYIKTDVLTGSAITNRGAFALHHRLYESLATDFGVEGDFQEARGGEKDLYRGNLGFTYTKRLPANGRLNAGLNGNLQYQQNRFDDTEGFVPQETHAVSSPFAVPFALRNLLVIPSSIVITKVSFGPLPPGCLPPTGPPTLLVQGRDFSVQTIGEITEIVPTPCSGLNPGINPGDTVAVNYQFSIPASFSIFGAGWRSAMNIDYRWIRPYFLHEETDQSLRSGRAGIFLEDQQSDTLGAEMHFNGDWYQTRFLAEGRRFRSDRQAFDLVRFGQALNFNILPNLYVGLSADQAVFKFTLPRRQDRSTFDGRVNLNLALNSELTVSAFFSTRRLEDSLLPDEQITSAGVKARWFFRRVEVNPSLEFTERSLGAGESKEYRVLLRIIRRF